MSAVRRVLRIGLLLALLALAIGVYFYRELEFPRRPPTGEEVIVFFPFGTSTTEIFRRLDAEGVVRPARLAEAFYRVARSATALQAGEYRFTRPTPLSEVIARMGRGDVLRHTIVVPEGLTAEETFELFWSRSISRPEAFRNAFRNPQLIASVARGAPDLEGFLFPDTYSVTRSTSARQIVETMLANFRRHFGPDLRARAQAMGLTEREAVTLASIVQKETSLDREEPVIAGVYWNRLRHRMRLQADPTVTYALKRDGKWTGTLYRSDYGYDSPFNTYVVDGLPPGPICNPGADALKAAASPAKTEFLYFVADGAGGHTFSKTFQEHLDAIATARRQRAASGGGDTPAEAHARNSGRSSRAP
ncbi:MAG TPA: endolytic transglycosylase MltG [Thermoanaerobaculia bacterium]|nr:endolytic transglycosylase MltG [Thermoanaerobaculia bacterium]